MFNRKQLCILAGMDLEAFKNAAKNNNLPFLPEPDIFNSDSNREKETYSRYSVADVLAAACTNELAVGGGLLSKGLTFAIASKLVTSVTAGNLMEAIRRSKQYDEVIYAGYLIMKSNSDEAGTLLFGTWDEIGNKLLITNIGNEQTQIHIFVPAHIEKLIADRALANGIKWTLPDWVEN